MHEKPYETTMSSIVSIYRDTLWKNIQRKCTKKQHIWQKCAGHFPGNKTHVFFALLRPVQSPHGCHPRGSNRNVRTWPSCWICSGTKPDQKIPLMCWIFGCVMMKILFQDMLICSCVDMEIDVLHCFMMIPKTVLLFVDYDWLKHVHTG